MFALGRDLNPRQLEAATFGDGPLRVIAGPGTGKTTTLTARVEYLLDQLSLIHISPPSDWTPAEPSTPSVPDAPVVPFEPDWPSSPPSYMET